jgi:hypothetical protein
MARKKLLSEGEVRQFMKLANLNALSENYFTNNPLDEESEEERELHATEDELGAEDHFADEEADDLGALEDEGGDNEALLARVVQAVADELGVEVDVEGADAEGGEEEIDVDAELDMSDEDVLGMDAEEELPGNVDLYEEKPFTSKKEKPGADKRKGAEKRGAEATRKKTGADKGEDAYVNEGDEIEEGFVDMKAARRPQTARERGLASGGYAAAERKCVAAGHHWTGDECLDSTDAPAAGIGRRQQKKAAGGQNLSGVPGFDESIDQEAIVAEVSRRVAERLNAAQQQEKLAEQLADRIFNRLTSK